jgi:preprotein translocase subunit SecA
MLKHQGIPHSVLNAKHHEREAEIIAQAGRKSTVTISTNMAGRGTDILLGGNPEFLAAQLLRERGEEDPPSEALANECLALARHTCEQEKQEVITLGGLHILGTERHEARRIDNQLRGRAGRQGDPGSSRFYLSLEDDLLRIFGSERIAKLMERLGIEEDEPIEHSWITKAIENAQKRVEARNFDIRKHLLEYDNVMNRQREIVYSKRRHILSRETITEDIVEMLEDLGEDLLETYVYSKRTPAPEDFREMVTAASQVLKQEFQLDPGELSGLEKTQLRVRLLEGLKAMYEAKSRAVGPLMPSIEKLILLSSLDALWKDHLLAMDHLKEGIGLRGYGQKDPLVEYQKEAYALFVDMMLRLREQVLGYLFAVELREEGQIEEAQAKKEHQVGAQRMRMNLEPEPVAVRRDGRKVGRNDPCPCGSGKKYKKCHGLGS